MHVWTLLTALAVVAPLACAAPPTDGEPGERPPTAREFDLPRDDAGNTIHVRATAANLDAQVLIVINGGPGLSHHYARALERLASPQLQVVTYDQRGVGKSSPASKPELAADLQVADLERIRDRLGAKRVHLVGHSWGGFLAMGYAATYPSQIASLSLVASTPGNTVSWQRASMRFLQHSRRLQETGVISTPLPQPDGEDCSAFLTAQLPAYYANPHHPATRDLGGSSCHTSAILGTWDASWHLDWREGLSKLTAPVLVAYGEADPFGAEPLLSELATYFARSRAQIARYPRCGHIPWEECPAPFYADLVGFLRAAGAQPGMGR